MGAVKLVGHFIAFREPSQTARFGANPELAKFLDK
jgi:hypothetical protein